VELFVEGECPLPTVFALTLEIALRIVFLLRELQAGTGCALEQASLVIWSAFPETTAIE